MDILKVKVNGVWVSIPSIIGPQGVTFTPSVSAAGVISWTNDGGLENPPSINIKGPQGDPVDVQINGVSIVSEGVADIPYADDTNAGVIKVAERYGFKIDEDGSIKIYAASDSVIKQAANSYRPVGASHIDVATFYGLAKAAGDTTQSQSNNAVGAYTDDAKAKILTMLGTEEFLAPIEIGSTSTRDYSAGDVFVLGATLQQATAPIVIGETFSASNHERITIASAFIKKSDAVSSSAVSSIWTGTQAEYEQLTPDANTLYLIKEV